MISRIATVTALALCTASFSLNAQDWRVSSQQTVTGFKFPESAAYDPAGKVLYVGNFGGDKLAPAEKDGKGYVSKVALDGKVLEAKAFAVTMNKPKGIWIERGRLWVTDIDGVWIFDLKTKKGRKLDLPLGFANDPAVSEGALYVTDNRNDKMVKVEPADFLNSKGAPKITLLENLGVNANGVAPAGDGQVYVVGFLAPDKPKGIYTLGVSGQVRAMSAPLGRLDGVYGLKGGGVLFTDWNTGSLSVWSEKGGVKQLATGFKGPADFAVVPGSGDSMTVVVPDLVASTLRFIQLRK